MLLHTCTYVEQRHSASQESKSTSLAALFFIITSFSCGRSNEQFGWQSQTQSEPAAFQRSSTRYDTWFVRIRPHIIYWSGALRSYKLARNSIANRFCNCSRLVSPKSSHFVLVLLCFALLCWRQAAFQSIHSGPSIFWCARAPVNSALKPTRPASTKQIQIKRKPPAYISISSKFFPLHSPPY